MHIFGEREKELAWGMKSLWNPHIFKDNISRRSFSMKNIPHDTKHTPLWPRLQ